MLIRFAFSNFRSFLDRTEVNWLFDGNVPASVWSTQAATGERASTVMTVIGANASGKTSLLRAILFLNWFAGDSFAGNPAAPLPLEPHVDALREPSEFEVDWLLDGRVWRYTLRCTPQRVLREDLYVRHKQTRRMRYIFQREWNEAKGAYRIKQQEFDFAATEALKTRPNASLLSTAAQYGVPLAQKLVKNRVWSNVNRMGRLNIEQQVFKAAGHFFQALSQRERAVELLRSWDLGLSNVEMHEMRVPIPEGMSEGAPEKLWYPFGKHKLRSGQTVELPFALESSGTQSAFVLLHHLLPVLEQGGLAVIDEFESDLHPHMLEPILSLFADKHTNPHGAQLLFTCHAVEVLNILHKSQVMLVEKDEHNESSAWRLDSVQGIRSDDNFYAKYMAGAYGAVPQL
ncbi:MAG: AAA family ATPase [Burkholderiaceae bacterium]|jgi:predicted ATPase|nr:AAA family ATPase [Burkholderiaceae bacterium]